MAKGQCSGLIMVLAAGALAGCSAPRSEPARLLRTEDFLAGPRSARGGDQMNPGQAGPVLDETPRRVPTLEEASNSGPVDTREVALTIGPAMPEVQAAPAERPVLIDAKVGEINGRPIRAQDVFMELGPRLGALRQQRGITRAQWLEESRRHIRDWLEGTLVDELFQAEARASLRPEQQMGLRHMVQDWSENLRREAGGSRAAAERRAQEQNKTIRQLEREREAVILILYQVEERIRKRVRVSWKDVRLYYERNADVYNPPARARLRIIRVPKGSQDPADVARRLEAGIPFAEVATAPENLFRREEGGRWPTDIAFTGEYATARLDMAAPLAEAARGLTPGQWTREPVEHDGHLHWIYLEEIIRTSQPLSDRDVQLKIAQLLNQTAVVAERGAYIERLKERASFTDLDEMARRLVEIVAQRYWPRS